MIRSMIRSTLENKVNYRSLLAGNTAFSPGDYDLLETTILTTTTSSVTFDNLDTVAADYKHLQLRWVARNDRTSNNVDAIRMQFNSDTGTNYAYHQLRGTGSSVISVADASKTFMDIGSIGTNAASSGIFGSGVTDILDFSSTSKNTTIRTLMGVVEGGSNDIRLLSGLYNDTGAITAFNLFGNAGDFVTGSRFSLYGIKAA